MRGRLALLMVAPVLAACGLVVLPNDPVPLDGKVVIRDCEATPLVFEGDTTLEELGLGAIPGVGAEATRVGFIRITRDRITHEQFAPPDAPVVVAEGQLLCIDWPDGSGMSMMLAQPFRIEPEPEPAAELPVVPIVAGLAILLVAGVSWIAFRREPPPSPSG